MLNPDGSLTQDEKAELLAGVNDGSMLSIIDRDFEIRLSNSVFITWHILQHKIGNGLIDVKNDLTIEKYYTDILQSIFPLITYSQDERIEIDLDKQVELSSGTSKVNIFVNGYKSNKKYTIAIILKYYMESNVLNSNIEVAINAINNSICRGLKWLKSLLNNDLCNDYVFFVMTDIDQLAENLHNNKNGNTFEWTQKGNYFFLEKPFFSGYEEIGE